MTSAPLTESVEWLEPDGLGGFASGTAIGRRSRRYQALLLTAATPPTRRFVLVNGLEAWAETPAGRFALSTQRYRDDVVYPDGHLRLTSFVDEPWPTWNWRLEEGSEITLELFVPRELSACVLTWKLAAPQSGTHLFVRPLLSGRDYHHLHHENAAFQFDSQIVADRVTWKPYATVPAITALSNGHYRHEPDWFRDFLYAQERERGLDCLEDLASPGSFRWELDQQAVLIFAADGYVAPLRQRGETVCEIAQNLRESEQTRRARFARRLHRSADAYLVRRGSGKTIIAGYPWFTDWGRDTFIALRGLCVATGCLDDARQVLLTWAGTVSEGMLPNRFPDDGELPEFNAVDASLWFIVAVHDYLSTSKQLGRAVLPQETARLGRVVQQILEGYFRGTRYGIHCDEDGLIDAGEPGLQLTWMDAKVGNRVVTPRVGKPVEVQALWLAALRIGADFDPKWQGIYDRVLATFRARFWNETRGCLYDVIDVDHRRGTVDDSLRPNQIFAVGGLPWTFLESTAARRVVEVVESRLWTPMGLRTLEPGVPGYVARVIGPPQERDAAYHQGTVWPWLMGPFVEAWLRVRENAPEVRKEAHSRFVQPFLEHLNGAGLGHVSEIADAEPPHTPKGCPFQAWSVGELIRISSQLGAGT